ncbi:protein INCREASED RESISTANCE TO MYZUS PERSICAE 1-like [Solanum dulcamara]|uniref:protein INCREASED RESISTANCE TO MYZUS PERSICAE 1-like n=1 Tax=Solanum dulcamara TaxID=45834 RepID=UPI0024864A55|nr:protein INCREASED RESISTANCE TO MYZUS PERSICAE 1-like [Solanum dulcamara]
MMRRTTSMTRITVDVMNNGGGKPSDHQHVSLKYHHRSSSDQSFHLHHIEKTTYFLTTCGLCNRRLPPSRDIYMYRGDTAFCSMECREKHMKKDKRKEKSKVPILQKKTENHHNYSELPSENSGKSKTIAAA